MEQENQNLEVIPADKAKIRKIWKVTLILFLATVVEFIIAFTVDAGFIKTSVFVILTIFKAFYIVSEFMHLGHEVKSLIYTVLLPCIFVVWLILALLIQGTAIFDALMGL